ncbi:MAG: DUF4268 domain-containing protein [bacterium]|nr:DUF4268 domain-containing protein [bacterium]MDE0234239.1 DUF4268 domain-containing protein [bacterium]
MAEIHALEPVGLRDLWPHEAHCFTPWLAENLSLLGAELKLVLEREGEEVTLSGSGWVDILARQATTGGVGTPFPISQPSQAETTWRGRLTILTVCVCLGYAANADASILVWVARDFSEYHRSILSWLNESDNIAVFAVEVRAFLVDGRKVADFNLVVEPSQAGTASAPGRKTASTYYAEFYRPVVAALRRSGLLPVGRGGFRGRYRSFRTGYEDVYYSAQVAKDRAAAALGVYGADRQHIFRALAQHRDEIDARLNGVTEWHEYWVWLKTEVVVDDPSSIPDEVGEWLIENLLRLKKVAQPVLDRVMADIGTCSDSPEEPG